MALLHAGSAAAGAQFTFPTIHHTINAFVVTIITIDTVS